MDMQGVTTYYSVINYWMMEEFIITVTRLLKSNPTIKGTIVLSIAILRHIFFCFSLFTIIVVTSTCFKCKRNLLEEFKI